MMLAALAFSQLLRDCAPSVSPQTMTAVVRVESGGNPLAIHDNSLGRAFSPSSTAEAVAWANQLLAMGHSLDIGLSQVNNANFSRLGLSVTKAFDPCTNLWAGSTILAEDYRSASRQFGAGQYALRRALGAYNTGSLFAGQGYVNQILAAAGLGPEDDYPIVPAPAPIGPLASEAGRSAGGSKSKAAHPIAGTETPVPSYTVQHTPGSPVVVLVGD